VNDIEHAEDPDLIQAIDDMTPIVLAMRKLSSALVREPEDSRHRVGLRRQMNDLTSRVTARASRIPMTGEALLVVINDALDNRARRGRDAPTRPSSRTLLRALTEAEQRVEAATRALAEAKDQLGNAERGLAAAADACRAWGAAPLGAAA